MECFFKPKKKEEEVTPKPVNEMNRLEQLQEAVRLSESLRKHHELTLGDVKISLDSEGGIRLSKCLSYLYSYGSSSITIPPNEVAQFVEWASKLNQVPSEDLG